MTSLAPRNTLSWTKTASLATPQPVLCAGKDFTITPRVPTYMRLMGQMSREDGRVSACLILARSDSAATLTALLALPPISAWRNASDVLRVVVIRLAPCAKRVTEFHLTVEIASLLIKQRLTTCLSKALQNYIRLQLNQCYVKSLIKQLWPMEQLPSAISMHRAHRIPLPSFSMRSGRFRSWMKPTIRSKPRFT